MLNIQHFQISKFIQLPNISTCLIFQDVQTCRIALQSNKFQISHNPKHYNFPQQKNQITKLSTNNFELLNSQTFQISFQNLKYLKLVIFQIPEFSNCHIVIFTTFKLHKLSHFQKDGGRDYDGDLFCFLVFFTIQFN